jgi:hypothetical protein
MRELKDNLAGSLDFARDDGVISGYSNQGLRIIIDERALCPGSFARRIGLAIAHLL